ncbi:unnamed protein product, partial [Owenia fusiformis]
MPTSVILRNNKFETVLFTKEEWSQILSLSESMINLMNDIKVSDGDWMFEISQTRSIVFRLYKDKGGKVNLNFRLPDCETLPRISFEVSFESWRRLLSIRNDISNVLKDDCLKRKREDESIKIFKFKRQKRWFLSKEACRDFAVRDGIDLSEAGEMHEKRRAPDSPKEMLKITYVNALEDKILSLATKECYGCQ